MSEKERKPGLFSKLFGGLAKTRDTIAAALDNVFTSHREIDEDFYDELEAALIQADIGVPTTMALIARLKTQIKEQRIKEAEAAKTLLRDNIADIMRGCEATGMPPLGERVVLLVVGVNGVGKTTSIGKMAAHYTAQGRTVLLAAADTFRAAAAEQLTIWSERAGVPIVRHAEGADPASVVFDAMSAAKARSRDLVLVDTAGRLHNKAHLMEELKKIRRVIDKEAAGADVRVLLVLDATTGQNGLSQAKVFAEAVSLDGIVLAKLDGTAKGGIALAIAYEMKTPVWFAGLGEGINDLQPFDAQAFVEGMLP